MPSHRSRHHARRLLPRWNTLSPARAHVLGVARTLTSATRLLDVLPLLLREDGIETYYTVNPGSAFDAGLDAYLETLGLGDRLLTWEEALRRPFDLAVACSLHRSMRRLDAPLMVMPHGAGYNRLVTESTGDHASPVGLSRYELMARGKLVPAAIGVSHEEQLTRLARTCPEALPRAAVIGDRCMDRIRRSLPLRDQYRARLGVSGGRRLVALHSTWSEHSLLGRHPDLPLRLVTALPADEFAVAAVLHPNVWARHSHAGVLAHLEPAMAAGLLVIPPQEGWRAAIVASDLVVGDHGSTSLYSAAAERAVLLAATGLDELDPDSPTAEFGRRAVRLDPTGDLHAQLREAAESYDPALLQPVIERQLGAPHRSGELLQRQMYAFFAHRGIEGPSHTPAPAPVPAPEPVPYRPPTTFDVTGTAHPDGAVDLRRRPVVARHHDAARGFYAVAMEETNLRWRQSAEVLARATVDAELDPLDWARQQTEQLPGLGVLAAALAEDRCLVRLRNGFLLEAVAERPWGTPRPRLDPLLLGAAVNLWLTSGVDPTSLKNGLLIRTGHRHVRVNFDPGP
ncbi:hypothetical protein [Streptomyces sp. NPDC059080]|uniref:hypothetical protein n=1 Tax=Streptomyces sp. NPDC059080 TaxID=3346718 RepID=UPI0036CA85B0